MLINKPKRKDLNHFNDSEAFIEYSNYQIHVLIMLFIWGSKLNISLVLITQSYFTVPKNIRLNSKHDFIMKIPCKREPQQMAINNS